MRVDDRSDPMPKLRRVAMIFIPSLRFSWILDGVPEPAVHPDTIVDVHSKLAEHDGDEANKQSVN